MGFVDPEGVPRDGVPLGGGDCPSGLKEVAQVVALSRLRLDKSKDSKSDGHSKSPFRVGASGLRGCAWTGRIHLLVIHANGHTGPK
jgi:hypothetical protein